MEANYFKTNNPIYYLYSADGFKRRVIHESYENTIPKPDITFNPGEIIINQDSTFFIKGGIGKVVSYTTDYTGNKIYKNNKLDKILFGNGYIKDNFYYFYIRDHLGNNRVVIQELEAVIIEDGEEGIKEGVGIEGGTVVQRTDYYPSGLPMTNGLYPDEQEFKYNGKEFDTMNGLNQYDYGARMYDPAIMRWHVIDPLAEIYLSWSPYNYVLNNPMRWIDIEGRGVFPTAAELRSAGEAVINDSQYLKLSDGQTFCSTAARAINSESGDYSVQGNANAMGNYLRNTDNATSLTQQEALDYANEGAVVWASYVNPNPKKSGHIAVVAPTESLTYSGSRGYVVYVFNVGESNGEIGLNYAFKSNMVVGLYILNADKAAIDNRIIVGPTLRQVEVIAEKVNSKIAKRNRTEMLNYLKSLSDSFNHRDKSMNSLHDIINQMIENSKKPEEQYEI